MLQGLCNEVKEMNGCNCSMKNRHYKSATQFYNASTQEVSSTVSALALVGTEVTDTGVSLDLKSNGIEIEHSGLYRITAFINFNATTAGSVTAQMYLNGVPLPDTLRIQTVAVGNNGIDLQTVRSFRTMCGQNPQTVQIMIGTDGTAAGSVTFVSGNALKEA